MNEIYFNQCILCNVKNCKYYHDKHCTLGEILVDQENKKTICASFEKKD